MKNTLIALSLLTLTNQAFAGCIGTDDFYTCFDAPSGNSYSVNKLGDSTYMNGYNSNTGSTWSQNSHTFGDTTQIYGTASDGSYWNETITPNAVYGTDSSGNSFYDPRW